ncbi:MAG TPA: PIN domain-containing protein [Solirubrobacterales bacterium]|nr:PIN domain-containing protein [Solirubrobacterales bacterium]
MLVAGSIPEHTFHQEVLEVLPLIRSNGRLIAHTMAETFSALTRRPDPHPAARVTRYLRQFLEQPPVGLPPGSYYKALENLANGEVLGGAVYDGLIAATAKHAGLRLLSLDRRAVRTYAMLDVDYEILI